MSPDADRREWGDGPGRRWGRAEAAVQAMQKNFAVAGNADMLVEALPRAREDPDVAYCWPLSQARAAACELSYGIPEIHGGLETRIATLTRAQHRYWLGAEAADGPPAYTAVADPVRGAVGDVFYDDNAWVGLQEVEEHLATHGRRGDLARAERIWELARSAESSDPELACPGGLFWVQGGATRNTVSTVPHAKLALRLHQITGDEDALQDAVRWIEWARDALLSPDGLFWDNIGPDGSYDTTYWTYNQGVPLGTEALLFEVTGEKKYRRRAVELFDAIVDHYGVFEGDDGFDEEPLQFSAILCANALMAESIIGQRIAARRIVQGWADRLWERMRDPDTDLYNGREREEEGRLHLLDQAGFARALAIAAVPLNEAKNLS